MIWVQGLVVVEEKLLPMVRKLRMMVGKLATAAAAEEDFSPTWDPGNSPDGTPFLENVVGFSGRDFSIF